MMKKILMLLSSVSLVADCDIFDADVETDLGAILFFGDASQLVIPDTVQAGQPFVVNVRTFGNGCVSFGRTELELDGNIAHIRPYDRRETGTACADILNTIDHPVTLNFNVPGTVTIRITGLRVPQNRVETVERMVVVR